MLFTEIGILLTVLNVKSIHNARNIVRPQQDVAYKITSDSFWIRQNSDLPGKTGNRNNFLTESGNLTQQRHPLEAKQLLVIEKTSL